MRNKNEMKDKSFLKFILNVIFQINIMPFDIWWVIL